MPTKGERAKSTDFSIAAIMAPRGPTFGHYHHGTIANTAVECPNKAPYVPTGSSIENRK